MSSGLGTLLLPFRHQMEILHEVEEYMKARKVRSQHPARAVLGSFGEETSFSVRYHDQSSEH